MIWLCPSKHMLMSVDSLLFIPVALGDAFFNHSACKNEACLEEENKNATQQLAGLTFLWKD